MDERRDSGEYYPGGRSGGDAPTPAPAAVVDDAVTRTSSNAVKSSGIWSAIWGTLTALPTGFTALYDWVVDQLTGKLSTSGGTMTGGIVLEERETTADMGGLLINGTPLSGGTQLRLVKWENGAMSSVTLTAENAAVKSDITALAQTVAGKLDVETSAYYFYVSADGHLAVRDAQSNAIYLFGGDGAVADGVARGGDLPYSIGVVMAEEGGVYNPLSRTIPEYKAADGDTTLTINMPQSMPVDQGGRARDFVLDVDNSANSSALGLEFELLGQDYALAVNKADVSATKTAGDVLAEMATVDAGARARFYFTETSQTVTLSGAQDPVPVISVQRMTIEVVTTQGGA